MNLKSNSTRLTFLLLILCVAQIGCVSHKAPEPTVRPDLTGWFNYTTCDFSKAGSAENRLADSLERFCREPAPMTETVMVVQLDTQNGKGVAECEFSDTQACEIVAEFCADNDGVGHCEFDKCYCE